MQFIDVPLWEDPVTIRREVFMIENQDATVTCAYCGDMMEGAALFSTNHGRVFNGWCSKRLFLNNRAPIGSVPSDMDWLASKGWTPVDSHDKAHWA
jgi:hypothetical protein